MWPGVMIHEFSHLVGCLLTFTKVYRIHLFSPSQDTLGFVEHEKRHNPIVNIIISIAPLFGVTTVIWLLTKYLWPDLYMAQVSSLQAALIDFTTFQNFFNFTKDYFLQYWIYIKDLISSFDLGNWQTYVFIYLMLTLSSQAAPSRQDLKHTYAGILGIVLFFVLIYYLDQWLQVPITWTIVQWLSVPVFLATSFLTYGIIFTGISVIIMLLISLVVSVFRRGVSR